MAKRADKTQAEAIILSAKTLDKKPDKPQRAKVEVQLIGGGVCNLFPTLDEAKEVGLKVGATLPVDVLYTVHGTEDVVSNGFSETVTLYTQRVFLAKAGDAAAKAA